jgi:16S rRNA (uracil1498-N3)-methyltransferase
MHRFFISPDWLNDTKVMLHGPVAHQLYNVLRMRPGMSIIVLDNQGWEYEIELETMTKKKATGSIKTKQPAAGEPTARITLFQSILKKDHFEWVLQKCTEIGVAAFVPLVSQRSIVNDINAIHDGKRPRWQKIITEAAEQSRRGRLPLLAEPTLFSQALNHLTEFDRTLIPWECEIQQPLRAALSGLPADAQRGPQVALFIGPEGGFSDEEINLAYRYGAIPVTLGPRILRAETAALAASLLALHELGETARLSPT